MRLMKEVLDKSGVREKLEEIDLLKPGSNIRYKSIAIKESFMVCVWLGGVRFSHTALDRFDEVLKEIFGWKRVAIYRIKELKYDFGIDGFCMDDFWATDAAFRRICFACNLMSLFRQIAMKTDIAHTLSTIRFKCIGIGSLH